MAIVRRYQSARTSGGRCVWQQVTHPRFSSSELPWSANEKCVRKRKVCTCTGGTGATGTECPTHNTPKCVSCTGDRYLSNGACPDWSVCSEGEFESTSPTNTRNRVCTKKVCTCSGGTGAEGAECPTHNTARCAKDDSVERQDADDGNDMLPSSPVLNNDDPPQAVAQSPCLSVLFLSAKSAVPPRGLGCVQQGAE